MPEFAAMKSVYGLQFTRVQLGEYLSLSGFSSPFYLATSANACDCLRFKGVRLYQIERINPKD